MPVAIITRQDAKQIIAEHARTLALLLDVLDDSSGADPIITGRTRTGRMGRGRRDEAALVARLNALARDPVFTPDARKLLQDAFTLIRIRSHRTVRSIEGNLVQRAARRLVFKWSSRRQPGMAPADPPSHPETLAQLSRTLMQDLDERRRQLSHYLDHYPSDPDAPDGSPVLAGSVNASAPALIAFSSPRPTSASTPRRPKPSRAPTHASTPRRVRSHIARQSS